MPMGTYPILYGKDTPRLIDDYPIESLVGCPFILLPNPFTFYVILFLLLFLNLDVFDAAQVWISE
jgi:hypothetical protein